MDDRAETVLLFFFTVGSSRPTRFPLYHPWRKTMTKRYRAFDIEWDTSDDNDGPDGPLSASSLGLPNEVKFTSKCEIDADDILETLSAAYGYCMKGCKWEEITDESSKDS
jgi:hypothetical protein